MNRVEEPMNRIPCRCSRLWCSSRQCTGIYPDPRRASTNGHWASFGCFLKGSGHCYTCFQGPGISVESVDAGPWTGLKA